MVAWLKSLVKDSLVYGIGFGVSRFLQIIVLPIIAKSLSLSEYGYYSNYVIFYTIAGGVFLLGMDNSVARFFFDSEEKQYHRKVFSIAFFCVLLTSLIAASTFYFFPSALLKIISVPASYSAALPYVLFTFPLLVLNNFFLSWFKWKRQKSFFLVNSIGTVVFLLIPLLIAKASHHISFLLIFEIIFYSQLLIVIVSIILAFNYIRLFFDRPLLIAMLKYGFPWMLVFFLGLSRSYLDRFFLTRYLNDDTYGVYNFSARLATILSLVTTAFDMSFGPLALSIWKKEQAPVFFARLQSGYVFFISMTACVISIVSPLLVSVLGGTKYSGAEKVLPFLLFSTIPLSLINFSCLGMVYVKKSFLNTITLLIGFTTVLILNFIFTPLYLQYGAVNASIAGHILIIVAGYYFSQKHYKIPFHFAKDGLVFAFFLALSILAVNTGFSANVYQDSIIKLLILLASTLGIFILFFKKEYQRLRGMIKNLRYQF